MASFYQRPANLVLFICATGESIPKCKPLTCGAAIFLSALIEAPTGQVVKRFWEIRQLTRVPPRCPCEAPCAILLAGAGKRPAEAIDTRLCRPCGIGFCGSWRAVYLPPWRASIASGYTPAALAGALPRHPLPLKGRRKGREIRNHASRI